MISNQILQSTIDGLKSITRKELSVVEKEGKVIATTEENMIGRQIDAVENFISSPAESQLILGYQYFKIYDNGVPEYVIQVKGEDESGYQIGKIAAFQIQSLLVAYKERYDKDNSVSRPEIQKFVGALQGQQAQKGLFITTASFSNGALQYAANLLGAKVVLVDGKTLTKLMIKHNLGVSVDTVYEIKKIDSDFFAEEL